MKHITMIALSKLVLPIVMAFQLTAPMLQIHASQTTDITSGSYTYRLDTDGNAIITSFSWSDEDEVVVPSELDGHTVNRIGEYGMQYCYADSISLPQSLLHIDDYAFYCCSYLTEIDLPDNLVSIGFNAFAECAALKEMTVPATVKEIGADAFSDTPFFYMNEDDFIILGDGILCGVNNAVGSVTLPLDVKTIGYYSLAEAVEMTSLIIPESVVSILEGAFEYCEKLEIISFPASLSYIAPYVFAYTPWYISNTSDYLVINTMLYKCRSDIDSVSIPEGVTRICDAAFENASLREITLPSTLLEIDRAAFSRAASLESISFPTSLKAIGEMAFYGCTSLKSVSFNQGLERIDARAFSTCTSLTEVALPDSIKYLGEMCFGYRYDIDTLQNVVDGNFCFHYTDTTPNDTVRNYADLNGFSLDGKANALTSDSNDGAIDKAPDLSSIDASGSVNLSMLTIVVICGVFLLAIGVLLTITLRNRR